MKIIFLVVLSYISSNAFCQPTAISCDYRTEITDSNYVIIWRKCKGRKLEVHQEGPVIADEIVTAQNYAQYRSGIWKTYSIQDGSTYSQTEYYKGVELGYRKVKSNEITIEYSIVKSGISTITYYRKNNKITQLDEFDLNDPEKKLVRSFYDINGDIVTQELWINGVKVN